MLLSTKTLKSIISALIFLFVFTGCFGFAGVLAVQEAQAQFIVNDPVATGSSWAQNALDKLKDLAIEAGRQVWEWSKDQAFKIADWIKDNALAVLMAAGLKLAAKFLLQELEKLMQKTKIESYLYYADFLIKNVYALEHITKNYDGRRENQLILLHLISESQELYGRMNPGSTAYQGIKNATLLNPKCQTGNFTPQDPNYYARLLESKAPECSLTFAVASYRDAAMTALSDAQRAADLEIRNSEGYKASRPCGVVATSEVLPTKKMYDSSDPDAKPTTIQKPTPEQSVDWVGTGASVVCALISYPPGYTATLVNKMIEQVVDLTTKPDGNNTTSAQLRSHLSNTMASMVYKLIQGDSSDSFVRFDGGNPRLVSAKTTEDRSLFDEVPGGVDAYKWNTSFSSGNVSLPNTRDEQQLRNFWNSFCSERLPLVMALKNGNYPEKFNEIAPDVLQSSNRIHLGSTQNNQNLMYYFVGNSLRTAAGSKRPTTQADKNSSDQMRARLSSMSIKEILNTPTPFSARDDDMARGSRYDYVWQILDLAGNIDAKYYWGNTNGGNHTEWMSLGRRYAMALHGTPSAGEIKDSSNWVPEHWPYYVDDKGFGYQYSAGDRIQTREVREVERVTSPEDLDDDNLIDETRVITRQEQYVVDDIYKEHRIDGSGQGTGKAYAVDSNMKTSERYGSVRVYEIGNDMVAMWNGNDPDNNPSDRRIWKLDKSVSVVVKDGVVSTNLNTLRSAGSEVVVVEFNQGGTTRVLAAKALDIQRPCAQEPYGPPINIPDLQNKVNYTRMISESMWTWVAKSQFIQSSNGSLGR